MRRRTLLSAMAAGAGLAGGARPTSAASEGFSVAWNRTFEDWSDAVVTGAFDLADDRVAVYGSTGDRNPTGMLLLAKGDGTPVDSFRTDGDLVYPVALGPVDDGLAEGVFLAETFDDAVPAVARVTADGEFQPSEVTDLRGEVPADAARTDRGYAVPLNPRDGGEVGKLAVVGADGTLRSTVRLDPERPVQPVHAIALGDGSVAVTGGSPDGAWIGRFDAEGRRWTTVPDEVDAVTLWDAHPVDDGLVVCGGSTHEEEGLAGGVVAHLGPAGGARWMATTDPPSDRRHAMTDVLPMGAGEFLVTGMRETDEGNLLLVATVEAGDGSASVSVADVSASMAGEGEVLAREEGVLVAGYSLRGDAAMARLRPGSGEQGGTLAAPGPLLLAGGALGLAGVTWALARMVGDRIPDPP